MTARSLWRATLLLGVAMAVTACGDLARYSTADGSGVSPVLPAPVRTLLPTVHIAPAAGWPPDQLPQAAPGTRVGAFARNLAHPRWLYVLPNGDVLVAETNAPPQPEDGRGIAGWVMRQVMTRAGAAVPSANRITLLRDGDGDGVAEQRSILLHDLNSPFGMALIGSHLYIAETDAVRRFPYADGDLQIAEPGVTLLALPAGTINHHWTKNLLASPDGTSLFVTVGSNSNVGERGMAVEAGRAAIWQVEVASGRHRVFAAGLRNPNGLAWSADGRVLWTVVNERDGLGSDLVPDFLSAVRDGGFYGWPYSYYGQHVDQRVRPQQPALVAGAIVPDYALGAHTAPLGLVNAAGASLPAPFRDGMFVGLHGSWNRRPLSGYKVVFVPFVRGKPSGQLPIDVLSGFLGEDGKACGRPVGVAVDHGGALLVADDVGNVVWRVSSLR